eukprot:2000244-Rhodomonas_salina.1
MPSSLSISDLPPHQASHSETDESDEAFAASSERDLSQASARSGALMASSSSSSCSLTSHDSDRTSDESRCDGPEVMPISRLGSTVSSDGEKAALVFAPPTCYVRKRKILQTL